MADADPKVTQALKKLQAVAAEAEKSAAATEAVLKKVEKSTNDLEQAAAK